jgi:hypothetical protein
MFSGNACSPKCLADRKMDQPPRLCSSPAVEGRFIDGSIVRAYTSVEGVSMPARLLLTVLILTNPICCQMFGSTGFVRAEEPIADCGGCTCECDKSPERDPSSDEGKPHRPCECPNCEFCQCVCAGAVVKDVVRVDDMDGRTPIDAIAEYPIGAWPLFLVGVRSSDVPMACGEANVGRAARIRIASLLC